jgi:hypothetical protein
MLEEKKLKKIAIVGCSDHKHLAPFGNDEFEIWGVNNMYHSMNPEQMKNVGKWFEIHQIANDGKNFIRRGSKDFRGQPVNDYVKQLGQLPCPVLMQRKWDEVPNSVEFPIKELMEMFKTDYYTNTISWEIAYALMLIERKEYLPYIGVWGVDMATNTGSIFSLPEYSHQRPSCEFWLGMCLGRGVTIEIPAESDLLKLRYLYGYQELEKSKWILKKENTAKALNDRMNKSAQQEQMAAVQKHQYIGALEMLKEMNKWD